MYMISAIAILTHECCNIRREYVLHPASPVLSEFHRDDAITYARSE
jgi:hypothetical protein